MGYFYSRYSYNRLRDQQNQYTSTQVDQSQLVSPELLESIKNTRTKTGLSTWESEFLQSIENYFISKKSLTAGQYLAFKKIELKFTDEAITARNNFLNTFTQEKRSDMKIVAQIYKNNCSRYHVHIYTKVLEDENFIPTKEQWEKFMNNKYSLGFLNNVKSQPKFNVGDTVAPSHLDKTELYSKALVLEANNQLPVTHAAGGKIYSILPYGKVNPITIEERYIKICR